jgi:aldehyde dehydrogenase (NAD+)
VWGTNIEDARNVAERLESGTVWVNTHFALAPDVPFGGWKQSGVGVEFGREGVLEFTRQQVMNVKKA